MNNLLIRQEAKRAGVSLWEVAEALGVADSTLYRQLRRELPPEKRDKALAAIKAISAQRGQKEGE